MKDGVLVLKCSTIKNMLHNCTGDEIAQVLDLAVDYVADGVDNRQSAPKGIVRMMLYDVTDNIDNIKRQNKNEYSKNWMAEKRKAEKFNKNQQSSTNSTNSNVENVDTNNTIQDNTKQYNKKQNNKLFVCNSAGAQEETNKQTSTSLGDWIKGNLIPLRKDVTAFFKEQGELNEDESRKFYDYNESLDWKCLPNWKRSAVAWINRINER